jgi:hypothetical protein
VDLYFTTLYNTLSGAFGLAAFVGAMFVPFSLIAAFLPPPPPSRSPSDGLIPSHPPYTRHAIRIRDGRPAAEGRTAGRFGAHCHRPSALLRLRSHSSRKASLNGLLNAMLRNCRPTEAPHPLSARTDPWTPPWARGPRHTAWKGMESRPA